MVAGALERAGIPFVRDWHGLLDVHLDFYLLDHDLHLEAKRSHKDRIAVQMGQASNVIALQGEPAVRWRCALLTKGDQNA